MTPPRPGAIGAACDAAFLAALAPAASATTWSAFSNPQPVTIAGYPGSAEEPFISPDGRYRAGASCTSRSGSSANPVRRPARGS